MYKELSNLAIPRALITPERIRGMSGIPFPLTYVNQLLER